jgi:hypothetical protein
MTDIGGVLQGYCPACGSRSLWVMDGRITCSRLECPRFTAVDELLADRETAHIVQFDADTFTVRHPLIERLDDALMRCKLHQYIAGLAGPPVKPGRYRATTTPGGVGWRFEELT